MVGVIPPALVAGFSQSIVAILYDGRYAMAGTVLMVLGLGAVIAAFQNASENLLVAFGRTQIVLVANIIRLCSTIPASFAGYFLFGFDGFIWFNLLATIPLMLYFFRQQEKYGLLSWVNELTRLAIAGIIFLLSLAASHLVLTYIPADWLHLGLKRH
jgi:O-antigen/teichoic acid export membrane protein